MPPRTILVFDVDGTLTAARQVISPEMRQFLLDTRKRVPLAVVGGSDLNKITEQLAKDRNTLLSMFDYTFSENGLLGYKGTDPYPIQYLENDFDVIHFFGDKTSPGGNDHEIFADTRTIGHTVSGPEDTKLQVLSVLENYENFV
uniref:Phosphomannomutase n=1 Tax=Caenorhabditis japonica TaxID=281687 RepID=A0A8R1DYE9_CAEJA